MSNNKFDYVPYINEGTLSAFKNLLMDIQNIIHEGLKDYPNFLGIQFVDVHAGGIQIRGFHKEINGHSYGSQVTIDYNMVNAYDCAEKFISEWKKADTVDKVKHFKEFIRMGEEYGWD